MSQRTMDTSAKSLEELQKEMNFLIEKLSSIATDDTSALGNVTAGLRQLSDGIAKVSADQHTVCDSMSKAADASIFREDYLKSNSYIWIVDTSVSNFWVNGAYSPTFYTSPLGYRIEIRMQPTQNTVNITVSPSTGQFDKYLRQRSDYRYEVIILNQTNELKNIFFSGNNAKVSIETSKLQNNSDFNRNSCIYIKIRSIYMETDVSSTGTVDEVEEEEEDEAELEEEEEKEEEKAIVSKTKVFYLWAIDGFQNKLPELDITSKRFNIGYELELKLKKMDNWLGIFVKPCQRYAPHLKWPFRHIIKIYLYNQVDDTNHLLMWSINPKEQIWYKPEVWDGNSGSFPEFPIYSPTSLAKITGGECYLSDYLRNDRILLKVFLEDPTE